MTPQKKNLGENSPPVFGGRLEPVQSVWARWAVRLLGVIGGCGACVAHSTGAAFDRPCARLYIQREFAAIAASMAERTSVESAFGAASAGLPVTLTAAALARWAAPFAT